MREKGKGEGEGEGEAENVRIPGSESSIHRQVR
jgi:hypothetical protein